MSPSPAPVFIVAPHRSGTTVLYSLLAASGCFNVTTAFHVLNRGRLRELHASGRLEEARRDLSRDLAVRAVKDEYGKPVTADHPEEYAYVLSRQGRRPRLTAANRESLLAFCRDVQAVQDPARPLLLKNPFDTSNFLFVRETFPGARFILLHRNPLEVVDSQLRLIRWMLAGRSAYDAMIVDRYRRLYDSPVRRAVARALASDRLPILVELVSRRVAADGGYVVRNAGRLGAQAISLTYPELCRDPQSAVGGLLAFLGLRRGTPAAAAPAIAPRESPLTPEVERRRARLERLTAEYRRTFDV